MPNELQLLIWSAGLALVQMLIAVFGAQSQLGLPMLVGNRDDTPRVTGWAGRAQRAHMNLLESLAIFAIVVLVAHATNRFNAATSLGAHLFFWGRVAYALVYIAGIPWVRTLTWAVSIAGILLIFKQLF